MLYVVAYDIPDDRRRTRVAEALKDFGFRVQYSVFEALLEEELLERLEERLVSLIEASEDRVRIYVLCGNCEDRVRLLGQGERTEEPEVLIV